MKGETLYTYLKEQGYLQEEFYQFLLEKETLLGVDGLKREDMLLLYYIFDEEFVVEQANKFYKTEYKSILKYEVTDKLKAIQKKLPSDIIPLAYEKGTLLVAGISPLNPMRVKELTLQTGISKIENVKALSVAVRFKLEEYTGEPNIVRENFKPSDKVRVMCIDAVLANATDIHMEPLFDPINQKYDYKVRFRVATDLEPWNRIPLTKEDNQKMISKLISTTKDGNDSGLSTANGIESSIENLIGDHDWAARTSMQEVEGGLRCVLRLHQTKKTVLMLEQLGFDEADIQILYELGNMETGAVWVTGAFGSGKNTTINSLIYYIVHHRELIAVEFSNPVEVRMPIIQRKFENAEDLLVLLSKLKKQDTDLVFIGEVPDKEIAFGVKELIDSNVQVITTTHLDRCWSFTQKLYDYYGDEYKNTLDKMNAIITQVMFKRLCPHCREEITEPTFDEFDYMTRLGVHKAYRRHKEGCPHCNYRGVKGVMPRVEILKFTEELVLGLLQCDSPIEASKYLKDYVMEHELNVEVKLRKPIEEGIIDINQVKERGLCVLD